MNEKDTQNLKDYIAKYCKNGEYIDAIFNELVDGGHKSPDDPFVKYMIPIIASKIAINEAEKQLDKIQRSIELTNMQNIIKDQVKIRESITKIEEILCKAKETQITEQKNDQIIMPFALIVICMIIAFGAGSLSNRPPITAEPSLTAPSSPQPSPSPRP